MIVQYRCVAPINTVGSSPREALAGSGRGQRSCCDKRFATRIHDQVQSLETSRAQQQQVAFFGEDDLVYRERLLDPYDRETDVAGDALAVRHHELDVLLLARNANSLEQRSRHPRVLASRIHENPPDRSAFSSIDGVFNTASDGKASHGALALDSDRTITIITQWPRTSTLHVADRVIE